VRIAGGIGIVACAAVIALAAGGGNVLGGLGGLFGTSGTSLEVAKAGAPSADIVASPTAAQRAALLRLNIRARQPLGAPHTRAHRPNRSRPQQPPRQPVAPQPAPAPSRPIPSVPAPPAPAPGGGQVTSTVGQTVKQVTSTAPPPLQPITKQLDNAVDTLVTTCGSLPVCP